MRSDPAGDQESYLEVEIVEETSRPEASTINPYSPPRTAASPVEAGTGIPSTKQQPFSHQAAKFSVLAPFVAGFVSKIASSTSHDPKIQHQVAVVIGVLVFLIILAALVLGCIGFIGGIRRGAVRTIIYSLIGVILNGALTLGVASVFYIRMRHLSGELNL